MASDLIALAERVVLQTVEGGPVEPDEVIRVMTGAYSMEQIIEAAQRLIERGKIALDGAGMVVLAASLRARSQGNQHD